MPRARHIPMLAGYRSIPAAAGIMLLAMVAAAAADVGLDEPVPPCAEVKGSYTTAGTDDEVLDDIDLLVLEVPIVVTAARREQKITTVPYAISVITAEDIRLSGARSVADALRLAPGVDVAELTWGHSAVSPRGFHGWLANQVLVMVDGRQIYDAFFGGNIMSSWPIQLEDIARIEVVRGPGGVTWGPNAVNGVINIITKDPADQQGLTITVRGGSQGAHRERIGYGFRDGKLRMRVSGEFDGADGFSKGGSLLRRYEDSRGRAQLSLYGIYEAGLDDTLTISAGGAVAWGDPPTTPLAGLGVQGRFDSDAAFLLGKWTHQIEHDSHFELTAFVNSFAASAGFPSADYRYQQFALQFGHTFKPARAHMLTWGIDTRVDLLDATNADPFQLSKSYVANTIVGAYVQDEWQFTPKWTLNLGGRVDYDSYGGFEPSGRAALSRQLSENSMVYGAVSRASHIPVAATRFLDMEMFNGLTRVQADRDIHAITLMAYEAGYRGRFFDRLETNCNLFWHEYDDLTTFSPAWGLPTLLIINFDNRAAASTYGVELDARWAVSKNLTLLGNYTFQHLDWRSSAPLHDKDVISPPKHKFMLGVRYSPTDDLHLSSHLYFVDEVKAPNPAFALVARDVPAYCRLDLRAEYDLWDDRASVAVGVRNLLDRHHYEGASLFLNDAQVPRMVYAELRVRFK